jgi:ligand-binding sensor domain-containing protein
VLSIIEDQSASLFLGAAVGVLWRETRSNANASEALCNKII